ncbi:MAG TPA: hypothetical protein PK402_01670 [Tepidisphaeraceae bacterium]|nr:hypothetical protein [Tepidisphaeraceae bacterium]
MSAKFSNLSDEALLLMYIGGELDKSTRREVEARLAHDADLRAQLESLRLLDVDLTKLVAEESEQPLARYESSLRKSLAMMRQHSLTSPLPRNETKIRSRASGWAWRVAIAAVLMVGFGVMLSRPAKKEIAIAKPDGNVASQVVIQSTEDEAEYAKLYDMFDAPLAENLAENIDSDPLSRDVAVLNELSQMVQ